MTTYENTILVTQDDSAVELVKEMNLFGQDGWEVTGVLRNVEEKNFTVFFKRGVEVKGITG